MDEVGYTGAFVPLDRVLSVLASPAGFPFSVSRVCELGFTWRVLPVLWVPWPKPYVCECVYVERDIHLEAIMI